MVYKDRIRFEAPLEPTLYILEIWSEEGELWVRRCDVQYYISDLAWNIMSRGKFVNEKWKVCIYAAHGDQREIEEIGNIDEIFFGARVEQPI